MKFSSLASIAAAALVSVAANASDPKPADFVGKAAPKFSFKTLDGETLTNSKLKGKVVILDFWATWCTNCIKASPTMQKLQTTYGDKLVVLGLDAMEKKNKDSAASDYQKKHGYTYKFVANADAAHKAFHGVGLPMIAILNKKGVVTAVFDDFDGDKSAAAIEAAVKAAL